VRLNFGCPRPTLIEGVERIKEALHQAGADCLEVKNN